MPVWTKKLNKTIYHLATFNEPLSKEATDKLPAHIVEEPAPEGDDAEAQRRQYASVGHMVRKQNKMGSGFNDLGLS